MAELTRLVEVRQQNCTNATELQKALDESLARKAVFETGKEEARRVAEVSDIRCHQNERELTELTDRLHLARTALAELQFIHCRCFEGKRRIAKLVEQLDTSERREVRTRTSLSALRRQLGDSQASAVRSQEELTHLRRRVQNVLNDVGAANDVMGDLIKGEVRLIEARVLDAIEKSLTRFRARLQATKRGDPSPERLSDENSLERRLVVRNYFIVA